MLWQPLITKTNDYTSSKSLRVDIKWEVHKRTWQGVSAKLESYIQNTHGLCYILMSTSFPTQGHHVVYMCPDVIFQILLLCSRPMTSYHGTCHVTVMSCASSLSLKRKRNIKSRKIDKRKRKMLVSKAFHNTRHSSIV